MIHVVLLHDILKTRHPNLNLHFLTLSEITVLERLFCQQLIYDTTVLFDFSFMDNI